MADEGLNAPEEVEAPPAQGIDGEPLAPGAPPKPAGAAPAGDLSPEITTRLQQAGLKPVAGETREAALVRLVDHLHGKSSQIGRERAEMKRELRDLNERLEPILRREYQERMAEMTRQQAAQIPDRETDPVAYSIWLQEQQALREQERDAAAAQAAELEQANAMETAGFVELAVALGQREGTPADPEAVAAYNAFAVAGYNAIAAKYPEASPEEIQEFLVLSQQDWVRGIKARGGNVVAQLVADYRQAQTLYGAGAPTAPPNGAQKPAAGAPRPGTAAASVAAEQARQRARSAVTRPAAARTSAAQPEIDPATMSEDDYVKARLHGLLKPDASQKRFGNREAM